MIGRLRSLLYTLARSLGNLQAVRRGRVGRRIARVAVGRILGRFLARMFRWGRRPGGWPWG